LDRCIFSVNDNLVRDVYVGGEQVIQDGHHADETEITARFQATLKDLKSM
jgi:formimidoylglutamate deiminase